MRINIVKLGTSPLICHNPLMVDPEYEYQRSIKAITSKRKKTDADLKEIAQLEWYGGQYVASIGGKTVISQPTSKTRKSLIGAAKINKLGKSVERSIVMTDVEVPLIYEGSEKAGDIGEEMERLYSIPSFRSRLSVGIGPKRVMRVRPQFPRWAMIVPALFIEDAGLNFDELVQILDLAGRAERIGDNRVNGYGAFIGRIQVVNKSTKPIEPTLAGVEKFIADAERKEDAA